MFVDPKSVPFSIYRQMDGSLMLNWAKLSKTVELPRPNVMSIAIVPKTSTYLAVSWLSRS